MRNPVIAVAGFSGAMAVALSAVGAHLLKATELQKVVFESALRMHFFHTLGLLCIGLLLEKQGPVPGPRRGAGDRLLLLAAALFFLGIFLFSASLEAYALLSAGGGGSTKDYSWLRKPAPYGGSAWIAGWLVLFLWALKRRASRGSEQV